VKKKTISIIVLAALLLAALLVFVCTDVKFDNPLDEKGTNFLGGHAKEDDYPAECKSLATNADGVPAFIYEPVKCQGCDGSMPTLKLEGPASVTITTNDVNEFRKWMHLSGGWSDLISWGTGYDDVAAKEPRLTKGGGTDVTFDANKTPEPGDYVIVYRIERPECNKKVPAREESRQLKVERYVAADTAGPKIALLGQSTVEVKQGETDKYKDEGVLVMSSPDSAKKYLDSITVSRRVATGTSVVQKLVKPIDDFTKIAIPSDAAVGVSFTITYYASRNGKTDRATRTVTIIEQSVTGLPKAVIELGTYKVPVGLSKPVDAVDTLITIGGTYHDPRPDVKRVYYVKDGKDTITLNATPTKSAVPGTSGNFSVFPMKRPITYNLEGDGKAGYAKADQVTRNVYLVTGGCIGNTAKVDTLGSAIVIKAGAEWNPDPTWQVTCSDEDSEGTVSNGYGAKFHVDFGNLDPKNPKKGTYTITYVGLGSCGAFVTQTRTVKVE
jgi:hypothetical protein